MTTNIVTQDQNQIGAVIDPSLGNLSKTLQNPEFQERLKTVLPSHVQPSRFIQIAQIAAMNNPEITKAMPNTLMKALIQCAANGLLPDGREAAIVAYGGKAQYQPMVDGVLKRLRMSGQVSNIFAKVVYEADRFDYGVNIDGEYLEHKPDLLAPRNFENITAVYAVAKMTTGERVVEIMTKEEVDQVMRSSKAAFDSKTGKMKPGSIWAIHYDRMAIETVLHRICRRLPGTAEIAQMLERDIQYDAEKYKQQTVAQTEAALEINKIEQQANAISPEQVQTIRALLGQLQGDEDRFCAFLSSRHGAVIGRIEDIPAGMFSVAVQTLEKNIEKRMGAVQQEYQQAAPQSQQANNKEAVLNALEQADDGMEAPAYGAQQTTASDEFALQPEQTTY